MIKLFYLYLFFFYNIENVYSICPINPSWRDQDPNPIPTPSRPLMTSIPSKTFYFHSPNQWSTWGPKGSPANISIGVGSSNGINIGDSILLSQRELYPETEFLVLNNPIPLLRSGVQHALNFQILLAQPQQIGNTINNITLHFVPFFQTFSVDEDSQKLGRISNAYYSYTWTNSISSSKNWINLAHAFTPTKHVLNSILIIQINLSSKTKSLGYYFKSSLKISSIPITTPIELPTYNELVKIPRPINNAVPQDMSKCPHKRTDLKHWHNPSTWPNNTIPNPNEIITLPENTSVLISSCSISNNVIFKKIIVPVTSELIFSDGFYEIHVKDIFVMGKLWMGSKECRFNGNITIIFHGEMSNEDTISAFLGTKGIGVAPEAFISMQGKKYFNSWTRLAATALPGDYIIYLQEPVNWEVGQKVFITTSQIEDEFTKENEILTIESISKNGKQIQFTTPLCFLHYAGVEYQAEVGLLTRKITMMGADDSEKDKFGGHLIIMGEGQIAGVASVRMGQINTMGRYPFHYHLAGTLSKSYMTDCSAYKSYFRSYTIHGTNNVTLSENVAFDTYGHSFYIEDGVEENNTMSFNLAAYTHVISTPVSGQNQGGELYRHVPECIQPSDRAASGFYISNCYNHFIGNSASGGWAGFIIIKYIKPIGYHKSMTMNPSERPFLTWEGNTAHSSGYYWDFGSVVYVGGVVWDDPISMKLSFISGRVERETLDFYGTKKRVPLRFNNTKTFLSTGHGISHWGSSVEVVGFESHDCGKSSLLLGQSWLSNAIVNGQSGNPKSNDPSYSRQGYMMFDTHVQTILSNINFRNFQHNPNNPPREEDNVIFSSYSYSDMFKPQGMTAICNISCNNVPANLMLGHLSINTGSSRFFNFMDWDGSSTFNYPYKTLVGSHDSWWNHDKNCKWNPNNMGVWVCSPKRPEVEIITLDINIPGIIYHFGDYGFPPESVVGKFSLFGNGLRERREIEITKNPQVTGVSNMGWFLYLDSGSPVSHTIKTTQVPFKNWVIYSLSYPAGTSFNITTHHNQNSTLNTELNQVDSILKLVTGSVPTYYFDQKHLYIKIIDISLDGSEYFERDGIRVYNINQQGDNYQGLEYNIVADCPPSTITQIPGGAVCKSIDELPYY